MDGKYGNKKYYKRNKTNREKVWKMINKTNKVIVQNKKVGRRCSNLQEDEIRSFFEIQ